MSQSDQLSRYEQLREAGTSPQEIYRRARREGLDTLAAIKELRQLFGFDLTEAKTVMLQAENIADSIEEYQEQLVPAIKQFLEEMDAEENNLEH